MFRKRCLTLVVAILLIFLPVVISVHAAPSLSLGSTASYDLTGKLQASQNCTAVPATYTLQACYGITPPPPPPPPPTITVWIVDNGICQINEPSCQFTPAVHDVPQGSTIIWKNNGTLVHAVTANATANDGLPMFNSGSIAPFPKGNFSYTFKVAGTYHYYDPSYTWMKGTINVPVIFVALPIYVQPIPMPTQVDLAGTVDWKAEALSKDQANLLVSHQVGLSICQPPGSGSLCFIPVTESGTFEQSVNLSTRVESPGTATSILRSLFNSLPAVLAGLTATPTVIGPLTQTFLRDPSNRPIYTEWWVNGPLSNGSPVQILTGWASVTGGENLNLGSLGTRPAWIVTSQFSQSLTVNNPLSGPTSANVALNFNLLWSYDKSADLLLRNNATITLTAHSVTTQQVTVYFPCPPQTFCTTYVPVTVTRDMTAALSVATRLSSTNINLPATHPATPASPLMGALAALPWMPIGLAGAAAAGLIALSLWLARRARRAGLSNPAPTPATAPPAPPATTPAG